MGEARAEPGVGFEYPPVKVSWLKRDLLLFAVSIGATYPDELHFLYELHPSFAAFPTYPILLGFKHSTQEVIDFYARTAAAPIPGVPKLDSSRVLDGERKMEFLRPIPVTSEGRSFELRSRVLGVYDKGKAGTVVETEQVLVDVESGDAYARMVGSGFFVGQGGWGGPKGPKTQTHPRPSTPPTTTHRTPTTLTTPHLYRLNGDYNPLHADPGPGLAMGLGGPILHGLFSWNTAAHAILQALGDSHPGNLRAIEARFKAPVKPGDVLVTKMWRVGRVDGELGAEGWEEVRFAVDVEEGGRTVLGNGRAVVRVVGERKAEAEADGKERARL